MRNHKCLNKSKTIKEHLGFNDFKLWFFGIPLASLLSPIVFFNTFPFTEGSVYWVNVGVNFFFCFVYWHIDRFIIIGFRKKYPDIRDSKKRVVRSTVFILIFTFVTFFLTKGLVDGAIEHFFGDCNSPPGAQGLAAALTITLFVIAVYETIYFQMKWTESSGNFERMKKKNAQAQLEALKNQVNPHFLFNSLNTLASIIPQDQELSIKFIEELSAVYRCILEIKNKDLVTLEQELNCLNSYEFLLRIRFGDNIKYVNNLEEEFRHYYVIPLSLQMLYENAIKHNVASRDKPLLIEMFTEDDYIVVRNNIQPKITPEISTNTGLENIDKRYKMLLDKDIVVEKTESHFSVYLPLTKIYDDESINY